MKTIQQQLADRPIKYCLDCKKEIKLENRRKKHYHERKYCSYKCYINFLKNNGNKNTSSHKMSKSRPWYIYSSMKQRCKDKNNSSYGGRGITYCDKWETFNGFWEDMGKGYKENLSLDRINNNENYCKENCRWVTIEQQANNRRNNVFLTKDNITKTISDWSKEIGISQKTVAWRYRQGWDINKILDKKICKTHYKNR